MKSESFIYFEIQIRLMKEVVKMEWVYENGKLRGIKVGFHEWAWSRRTSGFPIWAIRSGAKELSEWVDVGYTEKKPTYYPLPEDTIAVVRYYKSYKGYVTYYVYIPNYLGEYIIDEKNNFEIPQELPEEVKVTLKMKLW
jgi:hypothetical protein